MTPQLQPGPPPERKRYLHVLNGLPFGGNETLCLQLMERLRSDRRLLLNIGPDGGMRAKFEVLPHLELFSIEYRRDARIRFLREVTALLRDLRPDGIIVYPFGLHLLVAVAARAAGIPTLLVHAGNPPPAGRRKRRMWRAIVWASRLFRTPIVSCSSYVHHEFRQLTKLVPARSCVVHNGIDVGEIARRAAQARAARPRTPLVVGMVGRLNVIKDQDTLLRAMARVASRIPGVVLWIVGDGETREQLERLSHDLGLDGVVRFWGKRADAPELLGQMDVYVFSTSRDEGFGIAIIEAMAAGLPVVASDVAACREVLGGGSGILVPPRDADALATAIEALGTDETARREWGERARAHAVQFGAERCAASWEALLEGRTE